MKSKLRPFFPFGLSVTPFEQGAPRGYPEFISLSYRWVKPYLTPQIFPIYEGDPLSPPEGEAAQEVHLLDPRVEFKCSKNILAQRGPDEAAE